MSKANKEGWIRHRGGKCPVDDDVRVEYRLRSGTLGVNKAADLDWSHSPGNRCDIMAYRLHKPEQNSHEKEFDACIEKCSATESPSLYIQQIGRAYRENPLQWRDRITEIDATVEALEEERASLIKRLEDEGFALIKRKVEPVEDMSDWRNWKPGDNVEILTTFGRTEVTGQILVVSRIEGEDRTQPVRLTPKDDPDDGWWPHPKDMKWHSRPAS